MRWTELTLTLAAALAITSGCAAKRASEGTAPPDGLAAAYDDVAAAEMGAEEAARAPAMASAAPASMPAMPSTVLGSAPRPKPSATTGGSTTDRAKGEPAIEAMPTTGADVDQMLIFNGQLSLEVDFSTTADAIDSAVAVGVAAGGYVAQMTDSTLQLRVPSKNFRASMHELQDLGDVRSRNVQALDVSEEFNDLQVRLDNLRATRKRIEKLLGQSKDLAQILVVEKELQRVTGEIDQIEGRMRLLSSQAAFSTIAMAFTERPEPRELVVAGDGPRPPKPNPRMLNNAAPWMGQVGVHNLLSFND